MTYTIQMKTHWPVKTVLARNEAELQCRPDALSSFKLISQLGMSRSDIDIGNQSDISQKSEYRILSD